MNERSRPEAALNGSGGPCVSVPNRTDVRVAQVVPPAPPSPMPDWWVPRPRPALTSVIPCALCGVSVVYMHPLAAWQADMLPDLSWSRCSGCRPNAARMPFDSRPQGSHGGSHGGTTSPDLLVLRKTEDSRALASPRDRSERRAG